MGVHCCKTCRERNWGGEAAIATVWTQWTGYGECSRSCGGGIRSRTRQCFGYCNRKEEVESIYCNNQRCTGLECIDTRSDCLVYATQTHCQKSKDYMAVHCCKTCTERYRGAKPVHGNWGEWSSYG